MTPRNHGNRVILVLVEGDTERAAREHLKRFLDSRAGERPLVRLQMSVFDRGLAEAEVRGRAEKALASSATIGVIALTDLYPKFASPAAARQTIAQWLPKDPRCHVHVAKHDFEAWLLHGWTAILRQAGIVGNRKPWGSKPEDVDGTNPPAHRLRDLFQQGKPPRKYKKPVDGKKLLELLRLEDVAAQCPELKSFLNTLLSLAGYPLLP